MMKYVVFCFVIAMVEVLSPITGMQYLPVSTSIFYAAGIILLAIKESK